MNVTGWSVPILPSGLVRERHHYSDHLHHRDGRHQLRIRYVVVSVRNVSCASHPTRGCFKQVHTTQQLKLYLSYRAVMFSFSGGGVHVPCSTCFIRLPFLPVLYDTSPWSRKSVCRSFDNDCCSKLKDYKLLQSEGWQWRFLL